MSTETYDECLTALLRFEGGFTNDPRDPGGPTNFGITIHDARMYWKPNATATDVKRMPISAAKDIYRSKYWDAMRCDNLPAGVDFAVFDYGVNSGVSRSAKTLQQIVGVEADGKIGLVTLTATLARKPDALIDAIYDARLKFLRKLKTWKTFGRGWQSRCDQGRKLCHQLAGKYSQEIKLPTPVLEKRAAPVEKVREEAVKAELPPPEPPKPLVRSKTIWGGILGYLTGAGATVTALFEHLNNQWALIAFAIVAVLGTVAFILILKGRVDVQRVVEQLNEASE